jgi:hypothetical protein
MAAQLTVRVPKDLDRSISSLCQRLGLRRSDIVRMALQKFVEEFDNGQQNRPYERVKRLIGSVESGIPDLGSEHRKHVLKRIKAAEYKRA